MSEFVIKHILVGIGSMLIGIGTQSWAAFIGAMFIGIVAAN